MIQRKRTAAPTPTSRTNWLQFITLVLAFIGLWQVISGGNVLLHRLF